MRTTLQEEDEYRAAQRSFRCIDSLLLPDDLRSRTWHDNVVVINRYNALPFNAEVCHMLAEQGATPVNTHDQHNYVADFWPYYDDLRRFTFPSWKPALDLIPDLAEGYVVKGVTNSRKNLWKTHMRAPTKGDLPAVLHNVWNDSLLGQQDIVVREYVPLRQLGETITGTPISEEYRFFLYRGSVLGSGFYWSTYSEDISETTDPRRVPEDFVNAIAERIKDKIPFAVADVAITTKGNPILVELNDGQMAGLSGVDPIWLYIKLRNRLREFYPA